MVLRDLINLVRIKKSQANSIKTLQEFAIGMGIAAVLGAIAGILLAPNSGKETREGFKKKAVGTIETIKNTAHNKTDFVKDSTANAVHEVCAVIEKSECVKNEIKDGCNAITQDIHNTAKEISNELNKPVK